MDLSCQLNNSTYSVKLLLLEIITGIMCVLSITGCLCIIISFCLYKELRTRARLIVVLLAFSVLCYTTANLVGIGVTHLQKKAEIYNNSILSTAVNNSNVLDTMCKVQAGLAVFFYIASIFWTYCIAFYILMSVLQSKIMSQITFYFFFIISWLVPSVIIAYLIVYDYLGYSCISVEKNSTIGAEVDVSSIWCTIAYAKVLNRDSRILINVLAFDVWLFMGYLILPIIFILVKIAMKKQASRLSTLYEQCLKSSREIDVKLLLIPLAFILINVWSTVRDILFFLQHKNDYYWLVVLQSVGDCSQGLVIFVIYFLMTRYVRQAMRKKCCSCRKESNGYKTIKASPIRQKWWKISKSHVLKEVSTVN
ncbi:G-protein coupled receptor [Oopsacas minuta]|uniref:G-protein coupled receptor n=1 Tax=Oopsacas minuta TaxID=111878 RepID=A0AAV7KNJ9_9METZ|nr:G-protein coupled receptor [Oopsacas minuta]